MVLKPHMADTQNPLPYLRLQILQLSQNYSDKKRLVERRLHQIDNCIAELVIFFLLPAEGVFLPQLPDADCGMIG